MRTIQSPTPGMMMLVYDTTQSVVGQRGWSLTAKARISACLGDPCHGAKCVPVSASSVQYVCQFPSKSMKIDSCIHHTVVETMLQGI